MKLGSFDKKIQEEKDSLENAEYLTTLLVTLSKKQDTPELIAYLADGHNRLLLCKALVSPVSDSDRRLEQRAHKRLQSRGIDPRELKKRLEPAAFALGLVSNCDVQIDYYHVLGVKPSATSSELRAAYRKRAFELHPDTGRQSAEDETDFVTVKAAYDALNNPNSRKAFDQCRIALDAWHEDDSKKVSDQKGQKRPSVKARKAFFRVAAVVMGMVVIAWVISVLYESNTLYEAVEVTPSTKTETAREIVASASHEGSPKASVPPEAAKEAGLEKLAPGEPVPKEPERPKSPPEKLAPKLPMVAKVEQVPSNKPEAAPVTETEEPASAPFVKSNNKPAPNEPVPTQPKQPNSPPEKLAAKLPTSAEVEHAPLQTGAPVAEPIEPKAPPAIESKKSLAGAVREPLEKTPKERTKPVQKKKAMEVAEAANKQPPKPPAPVNSKSSEKSVQLTVTKASIPSDFPMAPKSMDIKMTAAIKKPLKKAPKKRLKPAQKKKAVEVAEAANKQQPKPPAPVRSKLPEKSAQVAVKKTSIPPNFRMAPKMKLPLTKEVRPQKPQPTVSETVQAKSPAPSKKPATPVPSVQLATNSPKKVFPDIPIPKTFKTPFVKRSQVVNFLNTYTTAYEKGNARLFFSLFTDKAQENGKPLKDVKPNYLKIWGKVQRLNYRISVAEMDQVVGSEWVLMKGQFKLNWKLLNGREGQSHGDISMTFKVNNDDVLRVSKLDYRFD